MNMHHRLLILSLIIPLLTGSLAAQRKTPAKSGEAKSLVPSRPHLTAVARSDQDSIVLRWAPSTALGWIAGNRLGYIIERVTMLKDPKAARTSLHRLNAVPIKPWNLDEWKARISNNNRYAAVAVQALYGKSFTPNTSQGPVAALKDAADELTNRFTFALFTADVDPLAATGLGLRMVDKNIKPGENYSYRIRLAGKDSLAHLDTAFAVASAVPFIRPPAPLGLAVEAGEHSVILRWKNMPNPRGGFTSFNIYKSFDGGKRYIKLNDLPYLTATGENQKITGGQLFTDTGAVDYIRYRYRVEGITPFADVSEPAEIEGMALDLTPPPAPKIKIPVQLTLQTVRILWDMPAVSPDLAGFIVSRSSFALKDYHPIIRRGVRMPSPGKNSSEETHDLMKLILPANARSFDDSTATMREPYYIVGAVDTAGNLSQSLPAYSETIDTTRPAMPKGLSGIINKQGVVHLRWNLGPEHNIIGYRVMWANVSTHEFSQCIDEPVPDTVFVDSVNIRTLSHFVYYRIAAVTDRYIQSPLSAIIALRRPDVVAPASPVFLDVRATDSSVVLQWAKSPSDDVAKQILYRRNHGSQPWNPLRSLGVRETQYTDTAVITKTIYEYQIEVVDSSGLHSPPSPVVQARPFDPGIRTPVKDLSVHYDTTSKTVKLNWKYASPRKERFWFVIYRAENQALVTEYSSLEGSAREFQDHSVHRSLSYKYAVRVKTEGGAESQLSESAVIRMPGK